MGGGGGGPADETRTNWQVAEWHYDWLEYSPESGKA